MKRLLGLLLIVLFGLSACSEVTSGNVLAYLQASANEAESVSLNSAVNISKGLYSYYLPPNIGRKTSTETSTILTSNNVNILMNLDVIDVIKDSYYETSTSGSFKSMLASTKNLSTFDGVFKNSDDKDVIYRVSVLKVNDTMILLTLEGGYFVFTAIVPVSLANEVLYDMILIARTAKVDSAAVLLAYSTRETIDYQKETLDMFSQIAPESGTVLDMISGGKPIEVPDENPTNQ